MSHKFSRIHPSEIESSPSLHQHHAIFMTKTVNPSIRLSIRLLKGHGDLLWITIYTSRTRENEGWFSLFLLFPQHRPNRSQYSPLPRHINFRHLIVPNISIFLISEKLKVFTLLDFNVRRLNLRQIDLIKI